MNTKFKNHLWSLAVALIVLLVAGGCTVANSQTSIKQVQPTPAPTATATPYRQVPRGDYVAMVAVPTAPAAKPAACRKEDASVKALDAQAHFEVGVKYFLEARQNADQPLLGHLLSRSVAEIAHSHFNRAIELNPDLAMAYVYRAATASLQGADANTVLADLNKAGAMDKSIYTDLTHELQGIATRIGGEVVDVSQQWNVASGQSGGGIK